MFGFFGKIASGVAYGIGASMGIAIWGLLKRLVRFALYGGGVAVVLHKTGIYTGNYSEVVVGLQQVSGAGVAGLSDLLRTVLGR